MKGNYIIKKRLVLLVIIIACISYLFTQAFIVLNKNSFDVSSFSEQEVYNHIKELTSPKYGGRASGSRGNKLGIDYVQNYFKNIGLKPAGDNSTYLQKFQTLTPIRNSESKFRLIDRNGTIVKEYKAGEQYKDIMANYGGSGEGSGNLLFIHNSVLDYSSEQLKGNILVTERSMLNDKEMNYLLDADAKALVLVSTAWNYGAAFNFDDKSGRTIPIKLFKEESFNELKDYCSNDYKVDFKTDYSLGVHTSSNVLGAIPGKNKDNGYIIISAKLDYLGSDSNKVYYPGAMDGASGVGTMLELAKVCMEQNIKPEKTLIFAAWNNQEFGEKGTNFYLNNPLYSLDKTKFIILNNIGVQNADRIILESDIKNGKILVDLLSQYSEDSKINTQIFSGFNSNGYKEFIKKDVPLVLVKDNLAYNYWDNATKFIGYYNDNMNNIDKQVLKKDSLFILNFINREIYKNFYIDYLNIKYINVFIVLLFIWILIILVNNIYLKKEARLLEYKIYGTWLGKGVKSIYDAVKYILLLIMVLFFVTVIGNFPKNFNIRSYGGEVYTNFSFFLTIKKSLLYVENLFRNGFGTTTQDIPVSHILYSPIMKSLKLLIGAIILSFIVGIVKGIFDAYRKNKRSSNLGSIVSLSIPNILGVILFIELLNYLSVHHLGRSLTNSQVFTIYIVPLICLSIIPTAYVSRIVYTSVKEEMEKEYIKSAIIRGLSSFQIIKNHILVFSIIKVVESLGAILTIIISNLIVIEYLYYYPGIIYSLIDSYNNREVMFFIALIICLGIIFIMFYNVFKFLSYVLNPLKREGK